MRNVKREVWTVNCEVYRVESVECRVRSLKFTVRNTMCKVSVESRVRSENCRENRPRCRVGGV